MRGIARSIAIGLALDALLKQAAKVTPANCPHCEYDRRFPPLEGGGWLQQPNNGPIVPCPVCNPKGEHPRQ